MGERGDVSVAYRFADSYMRLRAKQRVSLTELSRTTGIAKSWLSTMQTRPDGLSLVYANRIAVALGSTLSEMIDA